MASVQSPLPFLAVLVSLVGALLIRLSRGHPNLRETWTILAAVGKFAIVASMVPLVLRGEELSFRLFALFPGLEVAFRVDALGVFFALTASFLWIITSFYSIGYMRAEGEHAQTRYFVCFAVSLSATMGVAFAANLLTTFIFYEVLTLVTFPLVGHEETSEAMQGARKYLVYLLGTSLLFLLSAVVFTYWAAGTLDFAPGGLFPAAVQRGVLIAIFVLFVLGVAKAAMMPLHSWLPAAMVAPTPVSALLHAVAVVKTGVFVMVRVALYVFGAGVLRDMGLGTALAYYASFTIVVASLIALKQDNLKLRLAYSTVSQLSYIVLGAALLSPSAITGSVMHIVLHAFGKITLFFTAGAIAVATHKTRVSELDGIGRRMPFTMAAFSLGAVSMIGIPPLGGFISKWYLAQGSVEAAEPGFLIVLAASTVLNACYFLPIVHRAFFRPLPEGEAAGLREAPLFMVAPLVLTALGAMALFFRPSLFLDLAGMVAGGVLGGG
jgi:multicomponent Na+:H+ antiporter subunit D